MFSQQYSKKLNDLASKNDKNYQEICENLRGGEHKMIVEGKDFKKCFKECFNLLQEEFSTLEKVDLEDYWKSENDWTDKKR
ncbi:MAG: hypothetical protein J6K97_01595 [Clostridia bacterium]|nr:hypothetical protein [Clostridia bacterium]